MSASLHLYSPKLNALYPQAEIFQQYNSIRLLPHFPPLAQHCFLHPPLPPPHVYDVIETWMNEVTVRLGLGGGLGILARDTLESFWEGGGDRRCSGRSCHP